MVTARIIITLHKIPDICPQLSDFRGAVSSLSPANTTGVGGRNIIRQRLKSLRCRVTTAHKEDRKTSAAFIIKADESCSLNAESKHCSFFCDDIFISSEQARRSARQQNVDNNLHRHQESPPRGHWVLKTKPQRISARSKVALSSPVKAAR